MSNQYISDANQQEEKVKINFKVKSTQLALHAFQVKKIIVDSSSC